MGRTLIVGEALIDIVYRASGAVDEHPGGSPLNVAIGLARLGHDVDFATCFGADPRGELIRAHLERESLVHLTKGADTAASTSTAAARLDASGAATYEFDLNWDVCHALDQDPVGHLHTGSIAATLLPGADDVLAEAQRTRSSGTTSYDPNARPTIMGSPEAVRPRIEQVVALSDVVKASDEDIAWLYPGEDLQDVLRRWAEFGPALVVATLGADGAVARVPASGEFVTVAPDCAQVVDTVGAGDSFMAGLISGLLDAGLLGDVAARGRLQAASFAHVEPALKRASACAAITVSRAGANPPRRDELPSPSSPVAS